MKVLIIGLGSIAKKHIVALREIDASVEIIALRSSKEALSIDNIRNVYDWKSVALERPDFILISNPTALHFETLKEAKDFSIPLFIEKPLFPNIGDSQKALVENIVNRNIPTYVACNLRFLDSIQKASEIITNERINEVNVYCGSYLPDWRPNVDFRTIYSANKEMGGGVHIDLIHELDYIFWLLGNPMKTHHIFKNNSSLEITAVDYANYIWEYECFSVSVILNYYRRDSKRTMELVCDKGSYLVDLLKNNITYNGKEIFSSEQRIQDTYKAQMIYFVDNILKRNIKFNTINDGYKVLELCLKA